MLTLKFILMAIILPMKMAMRMKAMMDLIANIFRRWCDSLFVYPVV